MPSPIHPTLYIRKEGDRFVVGPIGWAANMRDKPLASRDEALNAVSIIGGMPDPLCMYLGPKEASQ